MERRGFLRGLLGAVACGLVRAVPLTRTFDIPTRAEAPMLTLLEAARAAGRVDHGPLIDLLGMHCVLLDDLVLRPCDGVHHTATVTPLPALKP